MAPRDPALILRRSAPPIPDPLRAALGRRREAILAMLFMMLAAALLAVTWVAPAAALEAADAAVGWLRVHAETPSRAAFSMVLLAAAALAWVVVWARATAPGRPVRVAGGRGTIPVREVAAWLSAALEARADVRLASVRVERHGRGVRVAARVAVTPDARLAETLQGARGIIEHVLAAQVGAPLVAAPAIELRYEELRLRPRRDTAEGV